MPVRRGHVAPKTTLIETIIRKFDTHSKYTFTYLIYTILIYIRYSLYCDVFHAIGRRLNYGLG